MSAQYKFFVIPVKNIETAEADLNRFLRSAKILNIHREFISCGENSFWGLSVEYLSSGRDAGAADPASRKGRVDCKAVLSPEDFALFVQLREWRKTAAEKEGTPVYIIFTNEQLAAIAASRPATQAALGGIEGVGEARLNKYGAEIISIVRNRVLRGGSWNNNARNCRSANRNNNNPDNRNNNNGFRLALLPAQRPRRIPGR